MQKGVVLLLFLIILPLCQAAPLEITSIDRGSVVIKQLDNPAKFTLDIQNTGPSDAFEIYSFLGVTMYPKGNFLLETGRTQLDIEAIPNSDVRNSVDGYYIFEYQIRSPRQGITKDTLRIKIVDIRHILSVQSNGLKQ